MTKKVGIFKGLKDFGKNNTRVALAVLWVSIAPSVFSLLLIPIVVSNSTSFYDLNSLAFLESLIFVLLGTLMMGLALMPTTLFAILSGFIFGWQALPLLILSYTLATLLGYGWGKRLGGDSLEELLTQYPKAAAMIESKKDSVGALIFFVRISPVIPFALSNLLFALMKTGWKKLVIWGTIGMLPRTTLAFFSGTLAFDIYSAIGQESISGKGWIFLGLLLLSIWGIWRFFRK